MQRNKKLVLLGGLVVLLLIVLFLLRGRAPSTGVDLFVSPTDSTILVDGQKFSSGKQSLKAGKHSITVQRDLFLKHSEEFEVNQGGLTRLAIALDPDGRSGEQWLVDHPKEADLREKVMSPIIAKQGDDVAKKYPIITSLPHIDNFYRVDYGTSKKYPNDTTKVALFVRYYTPEGKAQADEWLTFKGVNLSESEIIYLDMQVLD